MGSKCSHDRGKAAQRSRGLRGQMPRTPTLNQSCPELRHRGGSSQQEENQQGSVARTDTKSISGRNSRANCCWEVKHNEDVNSTVRRMHMEIFCNHSQSCLD